MTHFPDNTQSYSLQTASLLYTDISIGLNALTFLSSANINWPDLYDKCIACSRQLTLNLPGCAVNETRYEHIES
jgi:hypothetical protein